MCITTHAAFLPRDDPDASLGPDRDTLGFEVRNRIPYGGMRGIAAGRSDQPGASIVVEPPASPQGHKTVLYPDSDLATSNEVLRNG